MKFINFLLFLYRFKYYISLFIFNYQSFLNYLFVLSISHAYLLEIIVSFKGQQGEYLMKSEI